MPKDDGSSQFIFRTIGLICAWRCAEMLILIEAGNVELAISGDEVLKKLLHEIDCVK